MYFSNQPDLIDRRRGFTLVELLIVIAIISVMSTMVLVVLRGAQDDARNSATKSQLNQVRLILNREVEELAFRKMPVDINSFFSGYGISLTPLEYREIRKRLVADLINVEMPRFDAAGNPLSTATFPSVEYGQWLIENFDDQPNLGDTAGTDFANELATKAPANIYRLAALAPSLDDNSECLTAILLGIRINGTTGVEPLGNSSFVDLDGDGLPSLVDAWGDPINFFVRYVSDEDLNGDGQPDNRPLADGQVNARGYQEVLDAAIYTNAGAFPADPVVNRFEVGNIQVIVSSSNTF